jgi:bifunctional non-homologous end joining protein LigD
VKPEAFLFAFDMIELDGHDMRQMPLLTRKSRLLTLIQGAPAGIVFNEHMEGDGATIFRHACQLGCEGIVSKRADSAYRSGRSQNWITTKSPAAIEAQKVRSENWNQR